MTALDSFFICLDVDGRIGFGEVTPLPGYSDESPDSVAAELSRVAVSLARGDPLGPIIDALSHQAPFVASALACALETAREGPERAFLAPVDAAIPVVGLCGGDTPAAAAAAAARLIADGYRVLKLKVGGAPVAADLARVRAVATALDVGARLRLDANQSLDYESALALANGVRDLPVALLEQPFAPPRWDDFARLAAVVPVPLMLDESIAGAADIAHAAAAGAKLVKLKLCKHPGMAATVDLIGVARAHGLEVVFGNGVQAALGNHLEARVHAAAGLATAAEINGFLKLAHHPLGCRMTVSGGRLSAGGLDPAALAEIAGTVVAEMAFNK